VAASVLSFTGIISAKKIFLIIVNREGRNNFFVEYKWWKKTIARH
jgi:hypothetical protein